MRRNTEPMKRGTASGQNDRTRLVPWQLHKWRGQGLQHTAAGRVRGHRQHEADGGVPEAKGPEFTDKWPPESCSELAGWRHAKPRTISRNEWARAVLLGLGGHTDTRTHTRRQPIQSIHGCTGTTVCDLPHGAGQTGSGTCPRHRTHQRGARCWRQGQWSGRLPLQQPGFKRGGKNTTAPTKGGSGG